jgi:hypothetical protein
MPRYEDTWEQFGGTWIRVKTKRETVAEMIARCRAEDERRTAEGSQQDFLNAQDSLPVADWRDRHFNKRGR